MERRAGSDVIYLLDEKFDFDVSLSPDSSKCGEDEDDVFVDPSRHPAKCAPDNLVGRLEEGTGGARTSWSPLSGDQLDAVCQEAKRLAEQLQHGKQLQGEGEAAAAAVTATAAQEDEEHFILDGAAKLEALAAPPSRCSPVKRQTFLMQDSPMKDLPPAIRHRLQRGNSAANRGGCAAPATRLSARLSSSSPAGVKTRASLRGKAGLGALLPSKPAAPRTSSSVSRGPSAQKARVQPPGKVASGRKPSPSPDLAKSCEDILSDSASVASDVSDSSLDSSTLGKRCTLAPPTKVARPGMKATPLQSRKPSERRNTSSSSSSVSSFNSSLSLSPATGKLNSSQNRGMSSSTGPVVPGNVSQPANQNKRRSGMGGVKTAAQSSSLSSSTAGRRRCSSSTLPSQARKLSETTRTTSQRQTTPAKRTLDKTSAATARIQSGLKAKTKPAALSQTPTPSGGVAGRAFYSPDVSKVLKPKTRMSVASMDSLQQKASSGPLTPSAGGSRPLQLRPSGLPTPLKRRASAIPTQTPSSHSRTSRPPRTQAASDSDCLPGTCLSPAHPDTMRTVPVDVQPFCLEEEPPAKPSQSESGEPSSHGQSEPSKDLIQPESAKQEVLLLDLPAPTPPIHEKLLIDLSNTPDLIRNSTNNCAAMQQLIDLSSPLIKWSPEDKKENGAPLINLSF